MIAVDKFLFGRGVSGRHRKIARKLIRLSFGLIKAFLVCFGERFGA